MHHPTRDLRRALGPLSILAALLPPGAGAARQDPHVIPDSEYVMDELVAAHPYSIPGPITSSPDGDYVYAAEGGAIALLYADHARWTDARLRAAYETPLWRAPVGHAGVTPIEMLPDPDASWDGKSDAEDLLYLAAGRDGLWVMQASEDLELPRAFRVDDSDGRDAATQTSRQWCNDVKVLDLGGARYVLALFACRGGSNLRIYELPAVRGVAARGLREGQETGHELLPLLIAELGENPAVRASDANPRAEAYAFGMALDEEGPVSAKVYVAMGEHGIFRVPLKLAEGGLEFDGDERELGPWFGRGSAYVAREVRGGNRLYDTLRYYDDEAPHAEVYSHNPYFLDVAVQDDGPQEHRLYAALDHLGWVAFRLGPEVPWDEDIWTPLPENRASCAPGYPDFIQAGMRFPIKESQGPPPALGGHGAPQKHDQIRLVNDAGLPDKARQSCTRHVEVVRCFDTQAEEAFSTLVVSASPRRFIYDPGRMNSGRVLMADLNLGPVRIADYPLAANGMNDYTLAWDLRGVGDIRTSWRHNQLNARFTAVGGWDLHVPRLQPAGELHILHGPDIPPDRLYEPIGYSERQNLTRIWSEAWPQERTTPTPAEHDRFVTRDRFHRLGRQSISMGQSKLDARILVTSINDSGLIPDGPLVFDPERSPSVQAPMATGGHVTEESAVTVRDGEWIPAAQDEELTYGMTMDPRGGFVAEFEGQAYEYRMGFHPRNIARPNESLAKLPDRWRADRWSVARSDGAPQVTVDKELWFTTPASKFSVAPYTEEVLRDRIWWSGRPYYNVVSTFEDYNAYVAANYGELVDSMGLLFAGINGSPQGLWAVRMSRLKRALDQHPVDQDLFLPDDYSADGAAAGLFQGALVTHPEYWNIDDARTGRQAAKYFTKDLSDTNLAAVQNWYPDLFQLPASASEPAQMGWVLAVPAGYVALDPDEEVFRDNPRWRPDDAPFLVGRRRMMVRLFDVSDPSRISAAPECDAPGPNLDSSSLPALTLIGPDDDAASYIVKGVQLEDPGGATRHLLFIGDLSGRLYVYDVEHALVQMRSAAPPPKGAHFGGFFEDPPVATYFTQESLSDSHPHGVFGLEVVPEAWTDPETQEPRAETYVYLGVPRIGIEVLKLGWLDVSAQGAPARWAPDLPHLGRGHGYIGRIQTPGNASYLSVGQVSGETYLFLADYDGGIRIFRNPISRR